MKLITKTFRDISRVVLGGLVVLAVASCGGGGGSPGTVAGDSGTATVGSVSLIFSSSELKSAGAAGGEVTVTALVKTVNNIAIADVPVKFTASSGALSSVAAASDKNGQATALLGTSGDHTNRRITVTATAGGKTATGYVDVVGTTVNIAGPGTVSAGGTGDFTITVKDSANIAVANVPVSYSSQKGNPIAVSTSSGGSATAPLTNAQGQVVLRLTASQSGSDTLSATSQGATAPTVSINVNTAKLTLNFVDVNNNVVTYFDANGNELRTANTSTSCLKIAAQYEIGGVPQNGTINLNTSRGTLYSDNACTQSLSSSSVSLTNGNTQATYLKSATAGVATVTASSTNGPSAQVSVEFVAQLTPSATISLQTEPSNIGVNIGTGQSEKSTLTAIVRDGSTYNNFVKNAVVEFSIVQDQSGGFLSNPSVVPTASNGSASVVFIAGTADTPQNGVKIQAKIQGTSTTATATLTVAKKSLFIRAGTSGKLTTPDASTYQQDYAVIVTDASGNPVSGVTVTASIWPTRYAKGYYKFNDTNKVWSPSIAVVCPNEDVDKNGIWTLAKDTNNNNVLDPGIPVVVSSSGTTDTNGIATISLKYPRDRANWIEAQLTIHGSVSGTESTYQTLAYLLPVLSTDVADAKTAPPGVQQVIDSSGNMAVVSPYGFHASCSDPN